jgi:hypothetical protein
MAMVVLSLGVGDEELEKSCAGMRCKWYAFHEDVQVV